MKRLDTYKLEWSDFAKADRYAIFDYIEAESPRAAITVDHRIEAAIKGLKKFPEIGRPGRVKGTRELVIDRTPYIAAYRISGNMVRILRVLHGARQWPEEMPDLKKPRGTLNEQAGVLLVN
jgi:toxin ParE1/3/4